jgi:hypothetical protein
VPTDAWGAFGHGGIRAMVIVPGLDLIISWNDAEIKTREKENEVLKALVESAADAKAARQNSQFSTD